ncbi:DUF4153 domain-containing protein [Massilia pseudoviolaceinigra]|uniref:DUF4153 domain-containing protein n=1 Tax=Massilia pseudoviolaceinigra TaxID=3057165 RepID=UPI0027965063|nr:DUF4153 domain-containing protein [Massilia sp. CCM 9206]MDQ1920615.1 DUF4153 domain-containing protein [Massilia sp. CCM 9206]
MPTDPVLTAPETPKHIGLARAAIGLVQGLLLYLLFSDKVFTNPLIHTAALLACALTPVVAISGLGNLRPAMLGLWSAVTAAALTMIGTHAAWREMRLLEDPATIPTWPTMLPLVCAFSLIILFIAHSLVLAAAQDRRRLASYATHFDIAWKLFIQLAFSVFFTGALYLAMWLGASLFDLVKIRFLTELMKSSAFLSPLLACAFACALHLTDVRPAIVHGIRGLLLVLMSWLLPVATLLIGGFVLCLPFTGLDALWATRHATVALLAAVALLVVLINAAWQNGDMGDSVARVVRFSARIACVLLLPLTAIAIYALGLRVADHGWTSDRIFAAAALLVASFYALGYLYAAIDRGAWLRRVAPVNLAAAYAAITVLLALLSPLADPDRIAVNSQIARLESGAVSAAEFDYKFLKTQSKRYGAAALLKLKEGKTGPQATLAAGHATRTLAESDYYAGFEEHTVKPGQLSIWPASASLPASFPLSDWERNTGVPPCLTEGQGRCDVFLIDFDADGKDEILMTAIGAFSVPVVFSETPAGKWTLSARLHGMAHCPLFVDILKRGDYKLVAPRTRQIEIAGVPLRMELVGARALSSCVDLEVAIRPSRTH